MKPSMQIGNTATVEFVVSEKMQPRFDGIIVHPVCSTWDLAHQFEITSRKALVPHLEEGEEGITEEDGSKEASKDKDSDSKDDDKKDTDNKEAAGK